MKEGTNEPTQHPAGCPVKRIEQAPPKRDRWARPLIDGEGYTRASTLAKTLDDQSNLIGWSSRMTALGLAKAPDLIALASTATEKERSKLNDIVERAKDRASAGTGRDLGTAIHAAAEMLDHGQDISSVPLEVRNDAEGYEFARTGAGLEPLCGELFVANRQLKSAGSFDRLLHCNETGDAVIGDIKTGSKDDPEYAAKYGALAWSMQLAIYATALPYDDGWLTWDDWELPVPSAMRGVVFYIPRGTGKCYVIDVDLAQGLQSVKLAADVRDVRKASPVLGIRGAA